MCVIVGMKLPRDKDNKPKENAKWRLAKIRDRTYKPTFSVKRMSHNGMNTEQLFLVDLDTDWTEGVSINKDTGLYMGIVNSALNNKGDKKDDGTSLTKVKKKVNDFSDNGKVLRRALKQNDIENAVDVIVDARLDGNTMITDGDRLFMIEIYVTAETKKRYEKEVEEKGIRYEDVLKKEDYVVETREIDDEDIVVRTNHSLLTTGGGYLKGDGDSFESSVKRRDYAIEILNEKVREPIDLILTLSRMNSEKIDKNPFFRPIREFGKAISKSGVEIFSTAVIFLDPSGTIFLRPLHCEISEVSLNKLTDPNRKTNLVVLPAHIPLFEKFSIRSLIQLAKV